MTDISHPKASASSKWLWPIVVVAGMAFAFAWHIGVGAKSIPITEVFQAFIHYDAANFDHVVIAQLRLPRAIFAMLVGAALSVAGALMQGVTRNPLAEPGILGLLAGASFAVVLSAGVFDLVTPPFIPAVAALGAFVAATLVWGIALAAPGGATPLTLILSGAAVTAFLGAIITLANLLDEQSFEQLRVWLTGTLAGRGFDLLPWTLPWLIGGLAMALVLSRQVTALSFGDETAVGLGIDVARLRVLILLVVVSLTAAAVSIAGPLGFVGLVVPHVARLLVGQDYRLIIPYAAGLGAIFLLLVDILARTALAPVEISTGVVAAVVGAPFFVWLVRARL